MRRGTHKSTKFDTKASTATFTGYLVMNSQGDLRLSRGQPSLKADIVLPDNIGAVDASADVVMDLKHALRACPGVELRVGGKTIV